MPVYDYKCLACGHVFELLAHISGDNDKYKCPVCGSYQLDRMLSAPSLLRHRNSPGSTCCGRTERCDTPPCSTGGGCHRK